MAGYRRFVAYLYEYRKGKKESNCGFIRVEVRDQRCRMEVHLRCPGLTPMAECRIYGFVRNQGLMDGSLISVCRTREGGVEHALETNALNVGDSGVALGMMGGMILRTENGAFFGTEWDDQSIRPENFREVRREEPGKISAENDVSVRETGKPLQERGETAVETGTRTEGDEKGSEETEGEGKEREAVPVQSGEMRSETKLKSETEAGTEEEKQSEVKPEAESQSEVEAGVAAKQPEIRPESEVELQSEAESGIKSEKQQEVKLEAEAGAAAGKRLEIRPEVNVEMQSGNERRNGRESADARQETADVTEVCSVEKEESRSEGGARRESAEAVTKIEEIVQSQEVLPQLSPEVQEVIDSGNASALTGDSRCRQEKKETFAGVQYGQSGEVCEDHIAERKSGMCSSPDPAVKRDSEMRLMPERPTKPVSGKRPVPEPPMKPVPGKYPVPERPMKPEPGKRPVPEPPMKPESGKRPVPEAPAKPVPGMRPVRPPMQNPGVRPTRPAMPPIIPKINPGNSSAPAREIKTISEHGPQAAGELKFDTTIKPEILSSPQSVQPDAVRAGKAPGESWEPFSDGFITECRKIQIQDLRRLDRRDRALSGNRFLQHGYYSFGHLLLGKTASGQYILGVPGGYDQQERFMANMFGFPYFRESPQVSVPRGKGGYWYRSVNSPDLH